MKRRKLLQELGSVMILLVAIIILFHWYTTQNRERMVERNKNYATDSAEIKATQVNEEFKNALNLIATYAYFVGESLTEPEM